MRGSIAVLNHNLLDIILRISLQINCCNDNILGSTIYAFTEEDNDT